MAFEEYTVSIDRHPTGVPMLEIWRRNGKFDRKDGPAHIFRDPRTGNVLAEHWYRDGALHREDGPAWVKYHSETGEVTYCRWYHQGNRIHKPKPARPGTRKRQPDESVPPIG